MSAAPDLRPLQSANAGATPSRWWLLVLPLLFVVIRCFYASGMELAGDEAYYWTWSRNPALGYLDHAPMVAWLIRLSTMLLGSNELGVRFPGVVLSAGTILATVLAVGQFTSKLRDLLAAEVLLMAFPMLYVQAAIITPDTPATFFGTAAVAAALWCLRSPSTFRYAILGLASGLAMLSKYTALIPIGAIYLYLLWQNPRQLPRILLSGLLASLVVSPMLLWNYQHDWVSFRFQISHGTGSDGRSWIWNLGEYLGAQFLVATPLLLPLMGICIHKAFRRDNPDPAKRLLAVTGTVTLLFFALTSLRHKVEINWASLAYAPLLVLLAVETFSATKGFRRIYHAGLGIGIVAILVLHLPPGLLAQIAPRSPVGTVGGWKQLAHLISQEAPGMPVVCTRYQDASIFSFYMPGQPDIPILRLPKSRRTQMDVQPKPLPAGRFLLIHNDKISKPTEVFCVGDQQILVDRLASPELARVQLGGRRRPRTRWIVPCEIQGGESSSEVR